MAHGLGQRDRQVLSFVAAHAFVLAAHVRGLTDDDDEPAASLLFRLARRGLVRGERLSSAGAELWRITPAGLGAIRSRLPVAMLEPHRVRVELAAAWLWLSARAGGFGPAERVLSAREMRGLDDRRLFADEPQTPFGVELPGAAAGGPDGLFYPELMVVLEQGRVPIMVLLDASELERLGAVVARYAAGGVPAMVFMTDESWIGDAISEAASREGVSHLVHVQRTHIDRASTLKAEPDLVRSVDPGGG